MAADIPANAEGDKQVTQLAQDLLNGGWRLTMFQQLYDGAPERLRPALLSKAFDFLGPEVIEDPRAWLQRSTELPPGQREQALPKIARAWAMKRPEEAAAWLPEIPVQQSGREAAVAAVADAWFNQDERGALGWMQSLPPGLDRDLAAEEFVYRTAANYPEQALELTLGIKDELHRTRAAFSAVQTIAARDLPAAQKWIDTVPLSAGSKAQLETIIQRKVQR